MRKTIIAISAIAIAAGLALGLGATEHVSAMHYFGHPAAMHYHGSPHVTAMHFHG
jgi:hypothetical protein